MMQGATRERWLELCQQAAIEQDHGKLLSLIREINDLLEQKRRRLEGDPGMTGPGRIKPSSQAG